MKMHGALIPGACPNVRNTVKNASKFISALQACFKRHITDHLFLLRRSIATFAAETDMSSVTAIREMTQQKGQDCFHP
ncbi:hypothetical protein [Paraburkholderia fungorum]|uniref:hypothetical protein n=1 Tax=Paraburkholderia fungorum TaxID=134537 RepID=UPI0038BA9783